LVLSAGGGLRTAQGAGNTALLQAYDVDGAAYVTFATLTANNTPTFDLSASTTIGGNPIGSGDVTGPGSSTNTAFARFSGTTGKIIQDSSLLGDGSGNISGIASLTLNNAGSLRTSQSAGNTVLLQAYDVDGAAYVTFGTLTANNTPTFDLSASTTIGGNPIGTGNVTGPGSATDTAFARYNGTTGKIIQDSQVTCDGSGNIGAIGSLTVATGGALRSGTSAGNTLLIQGYDTDTGPAYVNFLTITSGTTPTCVARFSDGTASAPVYSFANETNMGFYRSASNALSFCVLGAQFCQFTNTAFQSVNSGQWYLGYSATASTPTYSFPSDTNNGWYRSAADEQSWTTNGTVRMILGNTSHTLNVPSTITGSGFTPLTLTCTDSGATAGPIIDAYRNSATPAAADILGQLIFNGSDSTPTKQEYARIEARIIDATSAAEKGALAFYTESAGTATKQVDLLDTGGQYRGNNTNTSPPAGYLGEQIRSFLPLASAVSLSDSTDKTITSISLTAGVWDISCIGVLRGTLTGTAWSVGISTTNNALAANYGDDTALTPTVSTAANDVSLSIPAFRATLASTTTYYLVGRASFTVGTATGYGRISATRVG
jgi:hypothetical protein